MTQYLTPDGRYSETRNGRTWCSKNGRHEPQGSWPTWLRAVDRVGVFAVSAGSPAAYAFAARYPERVWGLVSVGGVSLPDIDARLSSRLQASFMNLVGQKLAKLTASMSATAHIPA